MIARDTLQAVFGLEAVAATTPYVVVDLSDTTNFQHVQTAYLNILGLSFHAEKAADGVYDVWLGTVTENDATDGSASWFHVFHLEASGNPTDSTDRFAQSIDFTMGGANPLGIQLSTTGGVLDTWVTNQTQDDNNNWQNDTARTSPIGTSNPGVGDLVMLVEEVSGTGTLDFTLLVHYGAM